MGALRVQKGVIWALETLYANWEEGNCPKGHLGLPGEDLDDHQLS